MYFYPSDFNNDVYYLGGRRRRDPHQEMLLRRQQAYERAQQRQRQQALLMEERRRRQLYEQEVARRQQEENEEEEYYRHLAKLQERRARQARMRNPFFSADGHVGEDEDDDDDYILVRGPYGRLYRVPRSELMEEKHQPRTRSLCQKGVLTDTVNHQRISNNKKETVSEEPVDSPSKKEQISVGFGKADDATTQQNDGFQLKKKPNTKKKYTVIVEDVLSEDEDTSAGEAAASRSVWRNRHPGPGESWMEPINVGF
jgi:hypothetical protein